jgi:hypothetical protein
LRTLKSDLPLCKVRVAGSMDTTISDLPKFVAPLMRGEGLRAASRAEMTNPLLHLTTAHQFPPFLLAGN